VKIALDAMGGDLAPKAAIEGAILAARDFAVEVVLVGDRGVIERELKEHDADGLALTVEHAAEVVAMDESPLESLLAKPESSINIGIDLVKRGAADAFVSAGNSGAMMAAAMAILGNLPGVDRPAIASLVPTTAGLALLIDAGANTEVKPINLVQFGVMGSVYWKHVHNVAQPRVAILSNGEEATKGTDLTRTAAEVLQQMAPRVNYIGYVEGRDINRAKADVVVTDGFTGNVALKTMEGFAAFMIGNLHELFASGLVRRLAFLLVRKQLRAIRERLDPSEYGGAPLLGVNGVAIIAHGSSNARAIRNAVRAAANEALVRHVNSEIVEILADSPATVTAKPGGKGIRGLFLRMRDRLHLHREGHSDRKSEHGDRADPSPEAVHSGNGLEPPKALDAAETARRYPPLNGDEAGVGATGNSLPRRTPADSGPAVNGKTSTVGTLHDEGRAEAAGHDEDEAAPVGGAHGAPVRHEPS
jgi:glycerol-3-phosphate acyltransferase PlsX